MGAMGAGAASKARTMSMGDLGASIKSHLPAPAEAHVPSAAEQHQPVQQQRTALLQPQLPSAPSAASASTNDPAQLDALKRRLAMIEVGAALLLDTTAYGGPVSEHWPVASCVRSACLHRRCRAVICWPQHCLASPCLLRSIIRQAVRRVAGNAQAARARAGAHVQHGQTRGGVGLRLGVRRRRLGLDEEHVGGGAPALVPHEDQAGTVPFVWPHHSHSIGSNQRASIGYPSVPSERVRWAQQPPSERCRWSATTLSARGQRPPALRLRPRPLGSAALL